MSSRGGDKKREDGHAAARSKLRLLPDAPGVYLHKNADGKVLYVGKAKSLVKRVPSYFRDPKMLDPKTAQLSRRIRDFDYIVTETEAAALILEDQLVKEYRPRWNVRLKDDKRFPYIRISLEEPYPRVSVVRRLERDGARYFGPYTDAGAMRRLLRQALRIFQVRTCDLDLPDETVPRPCLDHQIKRCPAPCIDLEDEGTYSRRAEQLAAFLDGHTAGVAEHWTGEMRALAAERRYEDAAEIRDRLELLERTLRHMGRIQDLNGDLDVCAVARDGRDGCGVVLRIRNGLIASSPTFGLEDRLERDTAVFLTQLLREYYPLAGDVPPLVLLSHDPGDLEQRRDWLADLRGRGVKLALPQRGPKRGAVELALRNAQHKLNERLLKGAQGGGRRIAPGDTTDLQGALGLHVTPQTMECFDISTIGGRHTVGSLVYFRDGKPLKSRYRRFRIRTVEGCDDFASMGEVLRRHYGRLAEAGERPADLVIVDGGRGQLGVAREILADCGFANTELVGLAKREERVHFTDGSDILLPATSPARRLLQRIRDEAHRFAITYHRNLRARETTASELDRIPGIGPVKKLTLLHHFGSLDGIRAADAAALQEARGIGPADAERILTHFNLEKAEG